MPSRSAGLVEFAIELEALGERGGAVAECAAEFFVARDLLFPGDEGFFPLVVAFEQAGEVPGVFGFDFAAGEEFFGFGHVQVRKSCQWSVVRGCQARFDDVTTDD